MIEGPLCGCLAGGSGLLPWVNVELCHEPNIDWEGRSVGVPANMSLAARRSQLSMVSMVGEVVGPSEVIGVADISTAEWYHSGQGEMVGDSGRLWLRPVGGMR